MGLLGGILGGVLGAAFAGVWGAAIGAFIGYNVGDGSSPAANTASGRADVLAPLFRALAKIAKSDGVVSPSEAAFVSELLREFGGGDAALRAKLKREFDEAKTSGVPFGEEVRILNASLPADAKRTVLEIFCTLARADGRLADTEAKLLREAETIFGLPGFVDAFFDASREKSDSRTTSASGSISLHECYEILGIPSSASDAEVKKAWRQKTLEFHPDKLMGKGLSESFIEFADAQMKKINLAYETIKKSRAK